MAMSFDKNKNLLIGFCVLIKFITFYLKHTQSKMCFKNGEILIHKKINNLIYYV